MCGRFTVRNLQRVKLKFGVSENPLFEPAYNIAPTQQVLAVTGEDNKRHLIKLRWGLIPSWSKDEKIGYRLINARADSVASKPSFRSAFKKHRCLIPSDGFYEWKKLDKGKQPYFIHRKDDEPFAFAGLWESWHNPVNDKDIQSCWSPMPATSLKRTRSVHTSTHRKIRDRSALSRRREKNSGLRRR